LIELHLADNTDQYFLPSRKWHGCFGQAGSYVS
jgi:hypothetical protein